MKVFAVILLLIGIFNIASGGAILSGYYKASKFNTGLIYITLGIFMIDGFMRFFN